jgi:hypothetical protein
MAITSNSNDLSFNYFDNEEIVEIITIWKKYSDLFDKIQKVSITQAILDDVENKREGDLVRKVIKYQNELMNEIFLMNERNEQIKRIKP